MVTRRGSTCMKYSSSQQTVTVLVLRVCDEEGTWYGHWNTLLDAQNQTDSPQEQLESSSSSVGMKLSVEEIA
jgi:hypothetical protein